MQITPSLHDDTHLKVLRLLQSNPQLNQREIAEALGVSLGKTNYCVKALLDKGWIKMQNFLGSHNKLAYSYLLTPKGISEKAQLTAQFLQRKVGEYEALQAEIEMLRGEVQMHQMGHPTA
jgi:MarR family transcriptional regulator, temperature-dependent positive regulator of motility